MIILVKYPLVYKLCYTFMGKIRVYRSCAEAKQGRHLMDIPGFSALEDDGDRCALLCHDKMLLHR